LTADETLYVLITRPVELLIWPITWVFDPNFELAIKKVSSEESAIAYPNDPYFTDHSNVELMLIFTFSPLTYERNMAYEVTAKS